MNATAHEERLAPVLAGGVKIGGMAEGTQAAWASLPVRERLRVLKRMRHDLAGRPVELADAMPSTLARNRADTYAAEILPLLVACRFLEREAEQILKTKRYGLQGLPLWLAGVKSSVERIPMGTVLVIGPSNYPLFLPGVQVLQGLAAGNAVVWKPGASGGAVAAVVAEALSDAGLPDGVLRVTGESAADGMAELQQGVDKVFFTGSGGAGRAVLHTAADSVTPVVAELSGCDAVIVLPTADPARVAAALEFGMRLNGSATCMAPRRLMLVGAGHESLIAALRERFAAMEGVLPREAVRAQVKDLVEDAAAAGATVWGDVRAVWMKPMLVLNARPEMRIAQADVFAPILTVMQSPDVESMLRTEAMCPFGLTASIFGEEREARRIGERLKVGTVLINDLMVPTVDPRVPFGGRRKTGFGATRGVEGLLEMTAPRVVLIRRGKATWHYDATTETHEALFRGLTGLTHGRGLRERIAGLRTMMAAGKKLQREKA